MRRLFLSSSLCLLFTLSAAASVGVEKTLTPASSSRFLPAAAFEGDATFGIAWAQVDASNHSTIFYARTNEVADVLTPPTAIATTDTAFAPAIASTGGVSLV